MLILLAIASVSANATNHFVRINEIMAGYNGDSSIQYIEFVVNDEGQKAWGPLFAGTGPNAVGRAMIEFFDGAGNKTGRFVFPSNPLSGALNVLVATQEFADLTGIVPDFILPKGMLMPNAGRIVYGHNPSSPAAFHVVLTVSYGGANFTMPNDAGGAANPATLSIVGAQSLTRTTNFVFGDGPGGSNSNSNFALRTPTPCSTKGPNTLNARNNVTGQNGLPVAATLAKAGENIFRKETFRGNGRTCATCHAPEHQFGMPPSFVATLPANDPLFVHEINVNTITVSDNGSILDPSSTNSVPETNKSQPSDFVLNGTISDGFGNTAKVVAGTGGTYRILGGQSLAIGALLIDSKNNKGRLVSFTAGNLGGPTPTNGVPEGLEFSTLLRGTAAPSGVARALVLENINGIAQPHVFRGSPTLVSIKHTAPYGLSGEFSNLRDFSAGAVAQHFPLSLNRVAGVDFRNATPEELLALEAFQNTILTPADEDFDELNQFARFATTEQQKRGRDLFFGTSKCSVCHSGKALASSDGRFNTQTAVNENFNTGVAFQDINVFDGLPSEHDIGQAQNSRKFNVPTLLNIRKTGPYFHDNSANTLMHAVEFYDSIAFSASPAKEQVGSIIDVSDPLRVLDLVAFLESLVEVPFSYTRSVDFGTGVFIGSSPSVSVSLTNTGSAPLTISNLAIRGDHAHDFSNGNFTPTASPIAPGQQRTVVVTFSPTDSDLQEGTFEFDVSDGVDVYKVGVALKGQGTLLPTIVGTVAAQEVNDTDTLALFANVEIGNASPTTILAVTVDLDNPDNGTLTGGSFVAQGNGVYIFTGSFEDATQAIQALHFVPRNNAVAPTETESTTFTITVDNGVVQTVDSVTSVTTVSVNDAPVISSTVIGQQTDDKIQIMPFSTISIEDLDMPAQSLTLFITLDEPILGNLIGDGLSESGPGVYVLTGAASEVADLLRQTAFVPAENVRAPGDDQTVIFKLDITDGFAAASDSNTTVTVHSINDDSTLEGGVENQPISDTSNFLPFGAATVGDVDSPDQNLQVIVTLDDEAKGAMAGGGFDDQGGGSYSFIGTAAQATTALHSLVFTPAKNRVVPGAFEITLFGVSINDSLGTVSFDGASIKTFSVNDPPQLSGVMVTQSTTDKTVFNPFATLNVVDPDAFNQPFTVTVTHDSPTKGQVSGPGFTANANGLGFTGTLTQVNTALQAMTFTPVQNRISVGLTDTNVFSVTATDGAASAIANTLTVNVISINDAPTFVKGPHQILLEDSPAFSFPNWATAISPGVGSESRQNVHFEVTSEDPALFSVPPTISTTGTLSYTPAPDANGTVLVTVVLKDDGGTDSGGKDSGIPQLFSITLVPVNEIPRAAIGGSSLGGIAGVPVAFDASPSQDKDGTIVSYIWTFGDGSTAGSGVSPQHLYTASGTYTVTLTVSDDQGATSTVTQQIVIVAGDGGGTLGDADGDGIANPDDIDADGDGYSNDIEIAAGANPFDSASTPFGGGAISPEPLNLSKLQIGLNFSTAAKDSIQLSGALPLPENTVLNGSHVLLNVGGVSQSFTLNAKGQAVIGGNSFVLQAKAKNGLIAAQNAKFSAKLSKGTYKDQLADEKLTPAVPTVRAQRSILVALIFDTRGKHYQQIVDIEYSANALKGKAKK